MKKLLFSTVAGMTIFCSLLTACNKDKQKPETSKSDMSISSTLIELPIESDSVLDESFTPIASEKGYLDHVTLIPKGKLYYPFADGVESTLMETNSNIIYIKNGGFYSADLDGDGKDEKITFEFEEDKTTPTGIGKTSIIVSNQDDKSIYEYESFWERIYAYVIDLTPNDNKRELVIGYSNHLNDELTEEIYRFDDGKAFEISFPDKISAHIAECKDGVLTLENSKYDLFGSNIVSYTAEMKDNKLIRTQHDYTFTLINTMYPENTSDEVDSPKPLTLKRTLKAYALKNGKKTYKEIPKGTVLTFTSSDLESYMEFYIQKDGEDSQKYRFDFKINLDSNTSTIDGISEDKYFKNLYYRD